MERFLGKLLKKLGGKTIIEQTYLAAFSTNLFDDIYVVTDSEKIFSLIQTIGGKEIMSKGFFDCGSDRVASAVIDMDVDVVLNIQWLRKWNERVGSSCERAQHVLLEWQSRPSILTSYAAANAETALIYINFFFLILFLHPWREKDAALMIDSANCTTENQLDEHGVH